MSNPLLDKLVIQPMVKKLPSNGTLYEDGEIDSSVTNGEIKIYPLRGMDEIKLKSPDLLLSGEALTQVISDRCPQIKKPEELFLQDVDYITFMMRIASYGNHLTVPMTHKCEGVDPDDLESHEYNIDLEQLISNIKYVEASELADRFTCTLSTGHIVKFKPVRLKHLVELSTQTEIDSDDVEEIERRTLNAIVGLISSIDACTDKGHIKELLMEIQSSDYRIIEKQLQKLGDWGISYTYHTNCKSCDHPIEIPIDTNPLVFFMES